MDMFGRRGRARSLVRWLSSFGAVVAFAAQLTVALSPLGEARYGRSFAAHVEAGGTATHYAHNEASCGVCQARLLQGFAQRAADRFLSVAGPAAPIVATVESVVTADALSPSQPRAPPVG